MKKTVAVLMLVGIAMGIGAVDYGKVADTLNGLNAVTNRLIAELQGAEDSMAVTAALTAFCEEYEHLDSEYKRLEMEDHAYALVSPESFLLPEEIAKLYSVLSDSFLALDTALQKHTELLADPAMRDVTDRFLLTLSGM